MQASTKWHWRSRFIGVGLVDDQFTTLNSIGKADGKIKGIYLARGFIAL